MPRTHPLQSNFAGGEWAPRLDGRVDIQKYFTACHQLENFLILPQGGITRRPGTRFVAEAKFSDRPCYMVEFTFSTVQAYALELGDHYIRFYKDGARIESPPGTPVEVASPYAVADIPFLKFSQTADVLSIAHNAYPPHELLRFSHTSWILQPITFDVVPSREFGTRPGVTLTLSATTGTGVTATAGGSIFVAADIGRRIVALGAPGQALITAVGGATSATVTVETAFLATSFTTTGWKIDASPKATLTPTDKDPVGKTTTLTAGSNAFRSADVGKFVHIHGGTVEITLFTDITHVDGIIRGTLTATSAAPAGAWTLEEPAWSALNGYPRATGSYGDRHFWAGSTEQPQTIWGSKSGDFKNFSVGSLDDDAIIITISDNEVNSILWMIGTDRLYTGTVGGVFSLSGSGPQTQNPLTPSNVQVLWALSRGSSPLVTPLRVGDGGVIAQVSPTGKKVREIVYSFQVDKLVAPDLLLLSGHLTDATPISRMAYQEEPDSTLWAVRSDGVLLTCAYLRDQDIVGWARQTTQGAFESVCTVPNGTSDPQVWASVRRTINGATRRYIEVFDTVGLNFATLQTDATLTRSGGTPAATLSGLGHLENELVKIVGDGAVYPEQRVSGGQVTIDPPASRVEVGLGFTSTVQTMRPEIPINGSSQPIPKHWSQVTVRLLDTLGLAIQGDGASQPERIPFRSAALPLDQVAPPVTTDKQLSLSGWGKDARITMIQDQPLPATILLLTGTLDSGM